MESLLRRDAGSSTPLCGLPAERERRPGYDVQLQPVEFDLLEDVGKDLYQGTLSRAFKLAGKQRGVQFVASGHRPERWARSIVFSSCRTLPGQRYASKSRSVSGGI